MPSWEDAAVKADVNWFGVLAHHAWRHPDRAIAVFEDRTTTYQQMAVAATGTAGGLHERGVGPGDVVALLSYNCPEFLQTIFAANYLGAIAMPINWRLAAPEVRYILEHSEARALICDGSLVGLADRATAGLQDTLLKSSISADRRRRRGSRSPSWKRAPPHRPGCRPVQTTSTASCTPRARQGIPKG